jgi:oligoendopeptidase F
VEDELYVAPKFGQDIDKDAESGSDEEIEAPEKKEYREMFHPRIALSYIHKSWFTFLGFFLVYYLIQYALALSCANFFSQTTDERIGISYPCP